jgi:FlaG/FlaF family flagellin (archaellin)
MNTLLVIALVVAMAATVYVLVRGVIAMAQGKDVTGEVQQGYMQKRVMFQGIAILVVILILALASGGR